MVSFTLQKTSGKHIKFKYLVINIAKHTKRTVIMPSELHQSA